jgi:hypothetical protein
MRYAVIEAGAVKNVIESNTGILPGFNLVLADGKTDIGCAWDGVNFQTVTRVYKIPQEVTQRQARLALLKAGLLDKINEFVAKAEGKEGESMRIEWEFADVISRTHPLIVSLAPALGLTQEQIDKLFVEASVL